jgi:TatA/E family protein of Tat protein translocase
MLATRELIIVAVVTVLFLGPKKIPELAQGIAEAIRHLRKAFDETGSDDSATDSRNPDTGA